MGPALGVIEQGGAAGVCCRLLMGHEGFSAETAGGAIRGWLAGRGDGVVLLHGGPGLSYTYADALAVELASEFRVCSFQQRGLEPSMVTGPFTIAQAIDDVLAVLDSLGWRRPLIVGHSWGGHLALRIAAEHPQRLRGVLAIDPLGVVGDGGLGAFQAELMARTPEQLRARAQELDERAAAGRATPAETAEAMSIFWPSYFASPQTAAPMPAMEWCREAYDEIAPQLTVDLESIATKLAGSPVPYDVIAGAGSPMPWGQAARATTELSPRAALTIVPAAGHYVWLDAPGSVLAALNDLRHRADW